MQLHDLQTSPTRRFYQCARKLSILALPRPLSSSLRRTPESLRSRQGSEVPVPIGSRTKIRGIFIAISLGALKIANSLGGVENIQGLEYSLKNKRSGIKDSRRGVAKYKRILVYICTNFKVGFSSAELIRVYVLKISYVNYTRSSVITTLSLYATASVNLSTLSVHAVAPSRSTGLKVCVLVRICQCTPHAPQYMWAYVTERVCHSTAPTALIILLNCIRYTQQCNAVCQSCRVAVPITN